jgi:hypothetical protein
MKFFPALLFLLASHSIFAQVEILAEQDQDRNLSLMAFNNDAIPYTIRIEFSKLENLESKEGNILFKVAKPGKSNLLKLQSIYVNEPTGFNYKTQLFKGDFQSQSMSLATYLIPVSAGIQVAMRPLSVGKVENSSAQSGKTYSGVGFFFEKSVTVCAPRKGIIASIKMDIEESASGPANFETENYIEIYHTDGTFSRLSGLQANSAKVSVGETVIPGQEIATSSLLAGQDIHHVKMIQSKWEMGEMGINWINFPVEVVSNQGKMRSDQSLNSLESIHPKELIEKELDKKELKKIQSN